MNERGVTPAVAEVQLNRNNKIRLSGTALMDHKGKYVTTINTEETVLLKILQKNVKTSVSMTLPIPGESKQGPFFLNRLSFNAERLKTRIKTSYRQGKFRFDIQIGMTALLTERLFPYDVERQGKELEGLIAAEVQKRVESLLRKIQKHRIDPIGLGLYARAYEYEQYKKVEDDWGGALAKADIHASVSVSIGAMGSVR
ncbi:Ger(x)C family spore germination C-terminal domain-containing protein [Paenibacillus sp. P26]|nr:Ger(x)C family spore germination C-terminal domain-containing protein [Paenibacillus sp. P26]UUZ92941.1 Ger(x)C family spore germination C-terminal domain-containing protein [Paenibacillus sp. P25]